MVSLGISLNTTASHDSSLCNPFQAILVSLCCTNGALLTTPKLSSLNHKCLCFIHGSMALALLNAAGVGWAWPQHVRKIQVCSIVSFWEQDFSQVEGRSSESQAKPHKCHMEYIHLHSVGWSKSPDQAQSHRGGVGLVELGSILCL